MIAANVLLPELLVNFATTAQSLRNSEALHGKLNSQKLEYRYALSKRTAMKLSSTSRR